MLQRVLAAVLSSVVLAVLLLGVPLAVAGVGLTHSQAERSVVVRADALALRIDRLVDVGARVDPDLLDGYVTTGDDTPAGSDWPAHVLARLPGGDVVERGTPLDPEAAEPLVGRATTTSGVAVEVAVPRTELWQAYLRLVVLVAAMCAGAVAAGWALAQVQARRLVRPLTDLAATAEQLGAGRVPTGRPRTGIEEVDEVAGALATSAARIGRMLAIEREFSADASHQLRTPLTALSMRLEEITATTAEPVTAHEAEAALAQVERLTAVVEDLLHRTRAPTGGEAGHGGPGAWPAAAATPLRPLLEQQALEWAPVYAAAGRALDVAAAGREAQLRVIAAPGPVGQAVATLLENALAHGAGTTRVRVRQRAEAHDEEWLVVEVSDEGAGIPSELGARVFERRVSGAEGTGLGLALARDLVEAEGGRLELVRRCPPVFGVFLRRA